MSKPPYRRRQTNPIPRVQLAPTAVSPPEDITLEGCPACVRCPKCEGRHVLECPTCKFSYIRCDGPCAGCTWCNGDGMVTHDRALEWRQTEPPPPPEVA